MSENPFPDAYEVIETVDREKRAIADGIRHDLIKLVSQKLAQSIEFSIDLDHFSKQHAKKGVDLQPIIEHVILMLRAQGWNAERLHSAMKNDSITRLQVKRNISKQDRDKAKLALERFDSVRRPL